MIKTRLFVILFCIVCFASCSANGDNKINDEMKRSELVKLSFVEQQAILSNLKPEIRERLWKDKLSDTMASNNLTQDEKSLIKTLYDNMEADMYIEGTESHSIIIAECEKLTEVLTNDYGWTEEKLFLYLMTIMTEKELKDAGVLAYANN
ncbi:MAG: bacteriocin fulvocin C-related protein [Bacteroidales bacterium]|nr:bacteriocin fulvocin C-related protein [Bacteroidales bacterium]